MNPSWGDVDSSLITDYTDSEHKQQQKKNKKNHYTPNIHGKLFFSSPL